MNPALPKQMSRSRRNSRSAWVLAVSVWTLLCGQALAADQLDPFGSSSAEVPTSDGLSLRFDKSYALGVNHYQLDHKTKVTGWRMGERWFLGRQRGLDSGLTLVWQKQANQFSVSKDGVRFTRRF